ncbi:MULTISPECIES: SusC/RagA family TonB-linked outer membrane protein [Sphingobacterium]|uniref:SusC/RagA family TonB-linked outer membrane protein n=1 Tax=Sphingobacterium TaxID=28453 RepID=UPI0013DB7A4E|nr:MULTISPECIES: SusC/RagA family TonB-linked outer membrane protein [unclassified Sphingobacterium]
MKNFLRGGRGLSIFGRQEVPVYQSENKEELCCLDSSTTLHSAQNDGEGKLKAYSLWPKACIIIFCVLFSTVSVTPALGQEGQGLKSLQAIRIGDMLPEAFWQQRLKAYTTDGDSSYISLSDYRDKLLVLDFWATYCVPCVASVDKWNEWQASFGERVKVLPIALYNFNRSVLPFIQKRGWSLPVVFGNRGDTLLNEMFYYKRSFGQVWIRDGKLFAIPNSGTLTKIDVHNALLGAPPKEANYKYSFQGRPKEQQKEQPIDTLEKDETNIIDEVVVNTGYYTIPKERATGSFTHIDRKALDRSVGGNILERLEGIASGLQFDYRSLSDDDPTATPQLRVRGVSTLEANASPLIVIDNFPYEGNIDQINPNDIENVTILKDAAAASIWGARAGNGVIVITTKKGSRADRLRINWTSNIGLSRKPDLTRNPNYLPGSTVMAIQEEKFGRGAYREMDALLLPAYVELLIKKRDKLISEEEFARKKAWYAQNDLRKDVSMHMLTNERREQHYLNVNGGTEDNWFAFSAGYDAQDYSKLGDKSKRINLQAQNGIRFGEKFDLSAQLNFSNLDRDLNSTSSYAQGDSYESLFDEAGGAAGIGGAYRIAYREKAEESQLLNWIQRPLDEPFLIDQNRKESQMRFYGVFSYRPIPDIKLSANYQYQLGFNRGHLFYDEDSFYARTLINRYTQVDGKRIIPLGGIRKYDAPQTSQSHAVRLQTNWSRAIGTWSNLDLLAGAEVRSLVTESGVNSTLYGFDKDSWKMATITDYGTRYPLRPTGTGNIANPVSWPNIISGRYLSYFGNVGYSLWDKVMLSGSMRWDGSNLLGVNTNQRGTALFSIGGAYNLHREVFVPKFFDELKLRLTYGSAGNIDKSQSHYPTISLSTNTITGLTQAGISHPGNPDLRWEQVNTWNQGVDFRIQKLGIEGSIEFYQKKANHLLGPTIMDPTSGVPRSMNYKTNYAGLQTRGWDIQFSYARSIGVLQWKTTVLMSATRNRVDNYSGPPATYSANYIDRRIPLLNESIDQLYAFPWFGLSSKTGLPIAYTEGRLIEDPKDFTRYYLDLPMDNLVRVGSEVPLLFGSWMNSVTWKSFSISVLLGYKGRYFYRRNSQGSGEELLDLPKYHMDYFKRWKQSGDELYTHVPAYTPSVLNDSQNEFYKNSEILTEKGDHIRLQDISVSYRLPKKYTSSLKMEQVRFYVYAKNLGLLWKSSKIDIDPDYHQLEYPAPLRISAGVQLDF